MRHDKEEFLIGILDTLKAHFGDAAKAFWVYDEELCPCCQKRKIGTMMFEGAEAVSLNAFMYRERGVLIGYFLCGRCAEEIIAESKNSPRMHTSIEKNLSDAYLRYLNSFDA